MKISTLFVLLTLVFFGCNKTTEPNVNITDAIIYPKLGYLPLDTTIKYEYKLERTGLLPENSIYTLKTYLYNHEMKYSGDIFTTNTYNKEYLIQENGKPNNHAVCRIGTQNDNWYDMALDGINPYVDVHFQGEGKYKDNVFAYTHTIKDDTTYCEFINEMIVNNVRYTNILAIHQNRKLYKPDQYKSVKYFSLGTGCIKTTYTGYIGNQTTELLRSYK